MRRSLAVLLWIVAGLLASFLGTLAALVGTGPGRTLILTAARAAAAGALGGRIEIGTAGGPLLTGLQLTGVKLYDPDSTLVADLPRVEFTYRVFDLLAGRIILRDVTLEHPTVNLLQHKNGRLDIEELLHLGEHRGTPSGTRPLVLLRDVHVIGGTVLLRLQAPASPGDSAADIEDAGPDGRRRIRRFDGVDARVAALRLSSPTEHGIRIDVDSLTTRISDPPLVVRDLAGRITIDGDSLRADLERVGLPGTKATLAGWLHWPHGRVLYDLDVHADSATLADLRFIDPRFPAGAVDAGRARVRSHGPDLLEVRLDPLALAYHGGTLTGRVTALSRAGQGIVAIQGGDLTADNFDLGFARIFLDSLPFIGRLSGHTTVDGEIGQLALDLDWTFRDSLVPDWPVSRVRGSGVVGVDRPVGLDFKPFTVAAATVNLGTARRIVPALALRGTVEATGTLSGPLRNVRFDGALKQWEGNAPASVVHGGLRLDSRGDTLGVAADLTADTLSFEGLRGSFPGLPFRGSVAGSVRLAGPVTALDTHLDLGSPAGGRVRVNGTLELTAGRTAARGVTLDAADVDLASWISGAPSSRLKASVTTTVVRDSGRAPEGSLVAHFGPSAVAGAPLDSGVTGLRLADQRIYVDSLAFYQPGLTTTGVGELGWARPARGSLVIDTRGDSLNSLDSLLTWATGRALAPDGTRQPLEGSARMSATLSGALDSLALTVRASVEAVRARGVRLAGALARLDVIPGLTPRFTGEVTADSVGISGARFSTVRGSGRGTLDSLTWYLRTGVGDLAAVEAGGRLARGDTLTTVRVDSLVLQVPDGRWALEAPVTVAVADSVLRVGRVALTRANGGGRITAQGDIPERGPTEANVQLEGVPLAGVYALLERDTTGVAGTLTATLGLGGTRAAPTYTGSFALSSASFGEFRTPYVDGTVAYQGHRLDGTVHLWRSGQQILDVTAHLPLDLALEPVAQRQLPDTLAVRATADSVDLSALEAVTPALQAVRGFVWADLGMRGTWERPQLDGTVRIDSAGATIPALGVRYDQLSGRFRFAGDTISVESLSARSGGGTAQVSGFVRLDRFTKPMLGLSITADRFKALEIRNYLSVTASGRLALTGPVFGATLTGRGTVTNGVLYFADLINKRVVNLDSPDPWIASLIDTSITDLIRRERLGPAFQSVFLDSLDIRGLDLTMGSDVWLRSSEANIQLTGTVTLNKRLRNYLMSGTLQTPRGTYRLVLGPVTREFVVSQGTVRYFGTPDLDAALDITAKHVVHPNSCVSTASACPSTQQPDIPVVATIGGTLLVPKLTLSAENQDLSQTELISYLLFGQPSFADANRAAVLSGAVANIVSGEVERTVVSDLGIPIDYFEFRPGDPSDPLLGAKLAAGWQIGPKTFLVLNAGFCQGASIDFTNTLGASLQFRINQEFRTEASFEPAQSCSPNFISQLAPGSVIRQLGLDLFWEKRY